MKEHTRIVDLDALPASPWKNGGGMTRELARAGLPVGSGFAWRLSIADIERPGPFSAFPGYRRQLVLLDGTGLQLSIQGSASGQAHAASNARLNLPGDIHVFDGEDRIAAALHAGPCRVLNIMTARDAPCSWRIRLLRDASLDLAGDFVLLPVQGRWRARDIHRAGEDQGNTGESRDNGGGLYAAEPGTALVRLKTRSPPDVFCTAKGLAILLQFLPHTPPRHLSPDFQGANHDR